MGKKKAKRKTARGKSGERDRDGCDAVLRRHVATPDRELPIAAGGVAPAAHVHAGGDDLDGCEIGARDIDPTADEDLPPAAGGVR